MTNDIPATKTEIQFLQAQIDELITLADHQSKQIEALTGAMKELSWLMLGKPKPTDKLKKKPILKLVDK